MAALIGGGTEAQSAGLGTLFEAYGLAFQIIDDVLNLRGFEENRKDRGEDITQSKVTAPVAKAMSRLPIDQRRSLWRLVSSGSKDASTIQQAITRTAATPRLANIPRASPGPRPRHRSPARRSLLPLLRGSKITNGDC